MAATIFTFVFALACLATFVCGARKQWKSARLTAVIVAILSFFLALLSTRIK